MFSKVHTVLFTVSSLLFFHFYTKGLQTNRDLGPFSYESVKRYIDLKVYFHIISTNETVEGGWLPDSVIDTQMVVLNEAFNNLTGIHWVLASVDRTVNESWFYVPAWGYCQHEMKQKLRKGSERDLNIYTVGDIRGTGKGVETFGYTYSPSDMMHEFNVVEDGVVVLHTALPGGSLAGYNKGKVVVHEVGHWAGLLHTFESQGMSECEDSWGDFIDDTPAELRTVWTTERNMCPVGRNSCPDFPGEDPIHNYMDYSYDDCRYEFTPGQVTRMRNQLKAYRDIQI